MASEILINKSSWETRVAYIENGLLSDLVLERRSHPTMVGSIFRGRVLRVLPGMQAAFVDVGLDRAGFLYVRDILPHWDEEDQDEPFAIDSESSKVDLSATPDRPSIQDLLREGQSVLVQVAKDPLGTKGARLTMNLSLPGRFIVYMPTVKHIGISRKIEDQAERDRLKAVIQKINPAGGVIIRTAGEGAAEEELKADIEYLDRTAQEVQKAYEKKKGVGILHQEPDVELRVLRDLLNHDVTGVWIDDEEIFKKVVKFVAQLMPKSKHNIIYYKEAKPLFDRYDLDLEISRSMARKIWLKSGGYIVIDEAEALVVIDVNTGRFVGKKNLEDTILKTNLEAAKEIAHQLRIRNIGGIIIIDFIDMEKESHREKILSLLAEEVKKDRSRAQVVAMSSLGLVEMTRKRTRPSLSKNLTEPCGYCEGKGFVKRKSTVAAEIFREIERDHRAYSGQEGPLVVQCHAGVVDWVYESASEVLSSLEARVGRSVQFKIEAHYHIEQYEITNLMA